LLPNQFTAKLNWIQHFDTGINATMVSIQSGSKQDYFVSGQVGDMYYLGVMDGHGRHACIDYVRTLDFDLIASQPDPAQALWDNIQSSGNNFAGSGCTFTFARITHLIEVWNVGDSETHVYVNDLEFYTESHTFHNPKEIERTKHLVHFIRPTTAPKVTSAQDIQDLPSFTGYFNNGDTLVPSQSMGHNGITGFAPHKLVIPYKPTDRVRVVCVTDGVTDMKVDLSEGNAFDIANEADRKWKQPWMYKGLQLKFPTGDDVSCVVWENLVVEFPTLCVPYAPAIFTEDDVRLVFDDLGYIRKIEEFPVKDHKVFFIHFNPGVLNPTMREMYDKLDQGKPVKVWVRERWFWYLRISNHEDHVRKVRKVGWQYDRWDGTGDYYLFAKDELDTKTSLKLSTFLLSLA
jgi:serine/threonine protein phosphatase PrpC